MGKHEQKGKGYGFNEKSPRYGGMRATSKYSDCCPPTTQTNSHKVDSIGPILKGGSYKKMSKRAKNSVKRARNSLKRGTNSVRRFSKNVAGKVRKLTKKLRKRKGKSQRGGAVCPKAPLSNHNDPSKRKFGCRQGKWTPDCV